MREGMAKIEVGRVYERREVIQTYMEMREGHDGS